MEICFNGQWGTICNNRWTEVVAGVVCQMLGLGGKGVCNISTVARQALKLLHFLICSPT